jgi:hypothetical protein
VYHMNQCGNYTTPELLSLSMRIFTLPFCGVCNYRKL